ncbi:MAG: septum formation inhibitor Maf [Gammaproteobacteria bacterium]|nr:septum formation inhibitor Maf [Gammaproteobacteria bacterium]
MKIYLASASPRRQELLRQIDVAFDVLPADIVEQPHIGEPARDYVARLARAKARHVVQLVTERNLPPAPVLGADTEVVIDNDILGKPRDPAHGLAMLRRLSGRTHAVLTAVTLVDQDAEYGVLSESAVTFAPLSEDDIERYWATGEPADKAGGYAIQGRAAAFITRIEGSYSGIVGLPLAELVQLLKHVGRQP